MVAWKDSAVGLVCRCVCRSVAVAGRGFVGGRSIAGIYIWRGWGGYGGVVEVVFED